MFQAFVSLFIEVRNLSYKNKFAFETCVAQPGFKLWTEETFSCSLAGDSILIKGWFIRMVEGVEQRGWMSCSIEYLNLVPYLEGKQIKPYRPLLISIGIILCGTDSLCCRHKRWRLGLGRLRVECEWTILTSFSNLYLISSLRTSFRIGSFLTAGKVVESLSVWLEYEVRG